jgi:phage terminase large subunit-like protein
MTPKVSLRKALEDPQLLGSVLDGPSWHAWRSLLLAAMGEELKPDELETFKQFTGREAAPESRVDELWCVIGRRGGKSRAMAALAIYLAGLCDYSDKLARGEKGIVLLIAPDMKQAKVALNYAEGALESTPLMKQLIVSRTAETLTLTAGITLEVRSASFRRIRGSTCVAVLADECAFWLSDTASTRTMRYSVQRVRLWRPRKAR